MKFTQSNDKDLMQLEEEIAYFYGATNPKLIASHYLEAIQAFENLGSAAEKDTLIKAMGAPLRKAYAEVQKQTSLCFDLEKAAHLELEIILAQAHEESFEHIYHSMVELYELIFGEENFSLHKAALLRTFLYKYKINLLKMRGILSRDDMSLLRSIAKASEQELGILRRKKLDS